MVTVDTIMGFLRGLAGQPHLGIVLKGRAVVCPAVRTILCLSSRFVGERLIKFKEVNCELC